MEHNHHNRAVPESGGARMALLLKQTGDGRELIGAVGISGSAVGAYQAESEIIERVTENDGEAARFRFERSLIEAKRRGWRVIDCGNRVNRG